MPRGISRLALVGARVELEQAKNDGTRYRAAGGELERGYMEHAFDR